MSIRAVKVNHRHSAILRCLHHNAMSCQAEQFRRLRDGPIRDTKFPPLSLPANSTTWIARSIYLQGGFTSERS